MIYFKVVAIRSTKISVRAEKFTKGTSAHGSLSRGFGSEMHELSLSMSTDSAPPVLDISLMQRMRRVRNPPPHVPEHTDHTPICNISHCQQSVQIGAKERKCHIFRWF